MNDTRNIFRIISLFNFIMSIHSIEDSPFQGASSNESSITAEVPLLMHSGRADPSGCLTICNLVTNDIQQNIRSPPHTPNDYSSTVSISVSTFPDTNQTTASNPTTTNTYTSINTLTSIDPNHIAMPVKIW